MFDNTVVIHLAAIVGEREVLSDLEYSYRVNVNGAVNLARAVEQSNSSRFIFVSTSHVYATTQEEVLIDEDSACLPRGHYALQKLIAEEIITDVFRHDPSRLVIARVFSVLDQSQPTGTLGNAIVAVARDDSKVLSFVDDQRDFLSPRAVSSALATVANTSNFSGKVNICSGQTLSIRQAVRNLLGEMEYERVATRLGAGQSPVPRIIGCARLLEEKVGLSGSALFADSLADWRKARS